MTGPESATPQKAAVTTGDGRDIDVKRTVGARRLVERLPEESGVVGALIILVLIVGAFNPNFLLQANLIQLVANSVFFGTLALGTVFLLALGEIDLSIGWNFNFSAVITAQLVVLGVDPWLAACGGILFGMSLGLFNGLVTVFLGLPAIIITLGTLSVFQGLSLVVTRARAILPPDPDGSFFEVLSSKPLGVPFVVYAFVVLGIVLHIVFKRTQFGYRVQAVGSNIEAAAFSGIPIRRVKVVAMVLMGGLCGLAGAMFFGWRGAIDPTTGGEFLLVAIAAAIIGGTPVSGGLGTIVGAIVGALIISTIRSGVIFLGVEARWSTFVTGAVILLAVAVDRVLRAQRESARSRN